MAKNKKTHNTEIIMPEISIIIPTYNRADLLNRTIQSVLNQTFKNFEVIVIDDGSTDNTRKIVRGFIKKDERIKYIFQENSGGPAKPRSTGIKNSRGNYLAFLDSDDEWLPEKLEKQISVFKNSRDKKLGFVDCGVLVVNKNTETINEYRLSPLCRGNIFKKILEKNFILTPSSILLKRGVIKKTGDFDENLKMSDDWDFWIRISKKYNFDFIDELLTKYYVHSTNITKISSRDALMEELFYIVKKHGQDYKIYQPVFYRKVLKTAADFYCKKREIKLAKSYFLKAIKTNPQDLKSVLYYLSLFFGNGPYDFYFKMKKKFFKEKKYSDFRFQLFNKNLFKDE